MDVVSTPIAGLLILKPRIFSDERGYFYESYSKEVFNKLGITQELVQDNQSCSKKDSLRGLHFQAPPYEQGKLVRVIKGGVLDVAVDLRRSSPTYGQHFSIILNESNHIQFWIPAGMAHGFLALEDDTIFCYKCSKGYNKASEGGLRWNDPGLEINWGSTAPIVSEKDQELPSFKTLDSPFN